MFNFRWLNLLKRSFVDCLRRRKHSARDVEHRSLSKPNIRVKDKHNVKNPRSISSYHSIRTLMQIASPIILSSMLPTASANYCESQIYYFSAPINSSSLDQGLYAVQVVGNYANTCGLVKRVLYHGGCSITTIEHIAEALTGIIADRCNEWFLFSDKNIILSAVNNTLLTITPQLKCVLDGLDKCYDFGYYFQNIFFFTFTLALVASCSCGVVLCLHNTAKAGFESLSNRSARIRAEVVQNELVTYVNHHGDNFQSVNSPLLFIAQYANESIVPSRLRNRDVLESKKKEVTDEDDDLITSIPNTSDVATASTPLLRFVE